MRLSDMLPTLADIMPKHVRLSRLNFGIKCLATNNGPSELISIHVIKFLAFMSASFFSGCIDFSGPI